MNLKLGKLPHTEDQRDLALARYLDTSALPTPPEEFTSADVVADGEWGMLMNDQLRDCVPAGISHTQLVLGRRGGHQPVFSDQSVVTAYEEMSGYNPSDPSTDRGTDMRNAARYWQKKGIIDAQGHYHRSGVYLWLKAGDVEELWYASHIFENVVLGYMFPRNAMEAFEAGNYVWDYDPSSPDEGGHCVPGYGRKSGNLDSVSWGHRVEVTPAFIENKMDSGFAVLSSSILNEEGESALGLDREALRADLKQLGVQF